MTCLSRDTYRAWMSFPPQDTLERAAQALKTGARREAPSGRGRGHRRAAGQRGRGLLELPVAPAQLLRLGLVLRPRPAQLPKQVLVGADQGPGDEAGDGAQPRAPSPPRGPSRLPCCRPSPGGAASPRPPPGRRPAGAGAEGAGRPLDALTRTLHLHGEKTVFQF